MKLEFYPHEWEWLFEKCGFTNEEIKIIDLKRKYGNEWLNVRYAQEMNMPLRTFERRLKNISQKIIKFI